MERPVERYHLLIVSDLHLSEGRDPGSRKFSKNEDFFFDEEFARFLAYYLDASRWSGAKWHLIVNGDFFDFLQVVSVADAASVRSPGSARRGLGLPCGEQETIRKLRRIAKGHRLFFESLAGFVASGNLLTVIKGNHDVEFHYAGVRAAFLAELAEAFRGRLGRDSAWGKDRETEALDPGAVRFSDWFYYERELLWVEHGNRYEGFNSFKYWLSPLLPEIPGWPPERRNDIDLPFGSLFVRYLFNRIERLEPFADNVKPAANFVWWLIRKHPVTALRFLFRDGRTMLEKIRRAWADVPPEAWEIRGREHGDRLVELAGREGIELSKLTELDRRRAPSILKEPDFRAKVLRTVLHPWFLLPMVALVAISLLLSVFFAGAVVLTDMIPDFVRERLLEPAAEILFPVAPWAVLFFALAGLALFLRWLLTGEEKRKPSYLKDWAKGIADPGLLDVRYVVMGHTHDAELHALGEKGGRKKEYFNTGTWNYVFSEEEQLIRKPVEFVFVQGVRMGEGLSVKLLEWNDGAGEPRLLKLFRDEENA